MLPEGLKVYDCFLFFDELDVLEIRLNELSGVVDRFVLCESTRTFRGKPKPLYYERNKERFAEFTDRITHLVVDDSARAWKGHKAFGYERMNREALQRGLEECRPEDIVVLSDVDELWRPSIVETFLKRDKEMDYRNVRVRNCLYYVNTAWAERMPGPVIMTHDWFRLGFGGSMTVAREARRHGKPLFKGGWHLSCLGGADAVRKKLQAFSHWEYDCPEVLAGLEEWIAKLVHYRESHVPLYVVSEEDAPEYLKANRKRFDGFFYRHCDDGDETARANREDALVSEAVHAAE